MSNQLPRWTDKDGKEVQAVRITRMTEVEKDRWRIEHDEPHVEPVFVGQAFVEKAGGAQQDGFYVKDDNGERWVSAAFVQGVYTRQHMDYDETPEKGYVSKEAQAQHGPVLNQPYTQPTPDQHPPMERAQAEFARQTTLAQPVVPVQVPHAEVEAHAEPAKAGKSVPAAARR